MLPRSIRNCPRIGRLSLGLVMAGALACGKAKTLTVSPTTPQPPDVSPTPALDQYIYKKVLLLPLEGTVETNDLEIAAISKKAAGYYAGKVERALLEQGFEVISPEIVARVKKAIPGVDKMSSAEKAVLMGKETQADAVLMVQAIDVTGKVDFYRVTRMKSESVQPGLVRERTKRRKIRKKGRYYHSGSGDCLYRFPSYEVSLEAKMIDVRSSNVLWVGSAEESTMDTFGQSWIGKLDKRCRLVEENFIYADYLESEQTLDKTFTALLGRLLTPLYKGAVRGRPIPKDKPKVAKPAPPPPEPPKPEPKPEPEPPKVKTAIVSAKRGSLRAGPGTRNQRTGQLPRKTKVEIVETMGEWHKVKAQDGTMGWMHESVIIMSE